MKADDYNKMFDLLATASKLTDARTTYHEKMAWFDERNELLDKIIKERAK